MEPVALPFLGLKAGEKEFPGGHQAGEDFIAVAGNETEFSPAFGEDENGEFVMWVAWFASQNE